MGPAPTIAIVGRPNTGKSTLFNRLIGKRQAIIADEAGTTRDRLSSKWIINGYETILVDTGGLQYGQKDNIESDTQAQALVAIDDADVILFVTDAINNLTTDDFAAAEILRKSKKPVLLIANKCDHPNIEENVYNIYELGLGAPIQISAIHKVGIEILKDEIIKNLKELKFPKQKTKKEDEKENIAIAILGKPNAGKSSLLNAIIGQNKVIVSEIPGTTRDAIDTEFDYKGTKFNLIDTAGIRRPGKVQAGIEKFSGLRCLNAIDRSDIALLVIDPKEGITKPDLHILNLALQEDKGIIIVINKIDLFETPEDEKNRLMRQMTRRMPFIPWAPVVFASAKNKTNTYQILSLAKTIMEERKRRVGTAEFNGFIQKIIQKHLPASSGGKKPKFMYGSQVDIDPPKFVLFFKNPQNMHFSYPRYLENEIRKEFGFSGTAIQLKFKSSLGKEKKAN